MGNFKLPTFKEEYSHKNINGVDTYSTKVTGTNQDKVLTYIIEVKSQNGNIEIVENGKVINQMSQVDFTKQYGNADKFMLSKVHDFIDANQEFFNPEGEEIPIFSGDDEDIAVNYHFDEDNSIELSGITNSDYYSNDF